MLDHLARKRNSTISTKISGKRTNLRITINVHYYPVIQETQLRFELYYTQKKLNFDNESCQTREIQTA